MYRGWKAKWKGQNLTWVDFIMNLNQDWKVVRIRKQYVIQLEYCFWIGNYNNGKNWRLRCSLQRNQWHIDFMPLGGGNYENDGVKNWILGHKPAVLMCQILMLQFTNQQYSEKIFIFAVKFGQYSNGTKIGKWIIEYTDEIIGGGYYDEQGQNIGNWVEVHENFNWYILINFQFTLKLLFIDLIKMGKGIGIGNILLIENTYV